MLLEREEGPVLVDYPHDVFEDGEEPAACPVSFTTAFSPRGEADLLLSRFRDEILAMRNWYDLAKKKSGRTTTGISGLDADGIGILFTDFLKHRGETVPSVEGQALADALTKASQDLIDYYLEAVSAQPGQTTSSAALADWFWGETCAARVIDEVRKCCLQKGDKALHLVGQLLLIPRNQMHRFEGREIGR